MPIKLTSDSTESLASWISSISNKAECLPSIPKTYNYSDYFVKKKKASRLPFSPRKISVKRLSRPQDHSASGRIRLNSSGLELAAFRLVA
jgi:hypothetical protein